MVTCLGRDDSREDFIRSHLKPYVTTKYFHREGTGTIVKRRFIEPDLSLAKMFEVSFFDDRPLPPPTEQAVCDYLRSVVDGYDLVIVIDYGHGSMRSDIVKTLADARTYLAVNAQANSANFGFNLITKYPRADYVCIDEPEMRLAMHDRFGDLRRLVATVNTDLSAARVTVTTRGRRGATAWGRRADRRRPRILAEGRGPRGCRRRVSVGDGAVRRARPFLSTSSPSSATRRVRSPWPSSATNHRWACVPLFKFITALLK